MPACDASKLKNEGAHGSIVLQPGPRTGRVAVPSSKSLLHRYLVCAALGERLVRITARGPGDDVRASIDCLNALGARIEGGAEGDGTAVWTIRPMCRKEVRGEVYADCGQSASTLRFLLPLAGAMGAQCAFVRRGRLAERPMEAYLQQLAAHGMRFREEGDRLYADGKLCCGSFELPGGISSQFISGLLMAFCALDGLHSLTVRGALQSAPYIALTEDVLREGGVEFTFCRSAGDALWTLEGPQTPRFAQSIAVQGDDSAAVPFLCMGALSRDGIVAEGLAPTSKQPDRGVFEVLCRMGARVTQGDGGVLVQRGALRAVTADVSDMPDAAPCLTALACLCEGSSQIVGVDRLRFKESDRIEATLSMLRSLGASIIYSCGALHIEGRPFLKGGRANCFSDHRIAMAAAVATCGCKNPVEVLAPQCTAKSYPRFWDDFAALRMLEETL